MAYDEDLAGRIRQLTFADPDIEERRMFGGPAFLVGGHLSVAASGRGGLMVRVDPAAAEALLAPAHVRPFEMRGRPVEGWLVVDAEGVQTDDELRPWVERRVAYTRSLPVKH